MSNLGEKLFNLDFNSADPQPGSLLVAEPFLKQDPFNHAVVLLLEFNDEDKSVIGLVVNKLTELSMRMAKVDGKKVGPTEGIRLFKGGPVDEERMFYLHTLGPEVIKGAVPVGNGIYINGSLEDVFSYLESGYPTDGYIKFFRGYSGWSLPQLKEEMQRKSWAVAKVEDPHEILAYATESMWHDTLRRMGDQYRPWLYHPLDPDLN